MKTRELLISTAKAALGTAAVVGGLLLSAVPGFVSPAQAQAPAQKPNILFIMGDDIGWFNIGAYNRGIMAGKTPNLDKLAAEGMLLPTTTPRPAVPPDVRRSSPANCRSGPA